MLSQVHKVHLLTHVCSLHFMHCLILFTLEHNICMFKVNLGVGHKGGIFKSDQSDHQKYLHICDILSYFLEQFENFKKQIFCYPRVPLLFSADLSGGCSQVAGGNFRPR